MEGLEEFLREAFPAPDVWDACQVTGFRLKHGHGVRPDRKADGIVRKLKIRLKGVTGALPPFSPHWAMRLPDGKRLAHLAARLGALPGKFGGWGISDRRGWTAAHAAASAGTLPPGHDLWDLADRTGWTVRDEDFIGRKLKKKRRTPCAYTS